jgi:hypothetical protein
LIKVKFVEKVKILFSTISYAANIRVDFSIIEKKFVRRITMCDNVHDIIFLIDLYNYVLKRKRKVIKIFHIDKLFRKYNSISVNKNILNILSDNMSNGNNIFTTGLSRKKTKIDFMYYDDLDINRVEKKGKYFYLYGDSQYKLKHSNNKVTIYDIVDSKRTRFKLSLKNADIKIKNFYTDYIIESSNFAYYIYDSSIDDENLCSIIEIDLQKKDSYLVTSLVEIYHENYELFHLIGLASIFLVQDYAKKIRNRKLMMASYLLNKN